MWLAALVDARFDAELAAEIAMMFGIVALVGVRIRAMTAKAARNSRSNTRVSLTLAAVAAQATGTPSPMVAMWYLVPRLPRSVGLGPVKSPPRLARTEQVSRIRVGSPRNIPTSTAWTCANTPRCAHCSRCRRKVEPLTLPVVAVRLRHGVPSRRNWRKVASTRTVADRGWPRPRSFAGVQKSMTVAMRSKSLTRRAAKQNPMTFSHV